MDENWKPFGVGDMPLPMGVDASSGRLLPPLGPRALERVEPPEDQVLHRASDPSSDVLAAADIDPNRLEESGWGILFSAGADPAVRAALEPLIRHRRSQVSDKRLFRVFDGIDGYRSKASVRSWLSRFSVGLTVVDPLLGVPLYLTIVGAPDEIPFEFQCLLDTYWSVGRLCFETPAEYRAYAEHVVAYETASTTPHDKRVVVFSVSNPGDRASNLLMNQVAMPLIEGTATAKPLGERQGFRRQALLGDEATKDALIELLRGRAMGGPPALLFTGSHGVSFDAHDPRQRAMQGAILCRDWAGGPVKPEHHFGAADVPVDAKVDGLIHFLFASYGGGCPKVDAYSSLPDGRPRPIAAAPMVARLPQRMLASGALAVVAHIDRAWRYSFQGRGAPQSQEFRDAMVRVMKGERIGQCMDQFNLQWAVLSADLADAQRQNEIMPGQMSDAMLANLWVARDNARTFVLFGDPAARLRVEAMGA